MNKEQKARFKSNRGFFLLKKNYPHQLHVDVNQFQVGWRGKTWKGAGGNVPSFSGSQLRSEDPVGQTVSLRVTRQPALGTEEGDKPKCSLLICSYLLNDSLFTAGFVPSSEGDTWR